MSKSTLRRSLNRLLHTLARRLPGSTSLRPLLHRLRGVRIGQNVFIGDEVYLESEYPESIQLGDGVQISVRAIIIAHTRGAGAVIVGKNAYIGPNAVIACNGGRTLKIGDGAVIAAGTVITRDVPPGMLVGNKAPEILAKASISLCEAQSFDEFVRGLVPIRRPRSKTDVPPSKGQPPAPNS